MLEIQAVKTSLSLEIDRQKRTLQSTFSEGIVHPEN